MTTWEYATVPLIVHATKAILDQWGADGWELVQVIPGPDGTGLVAYNNVVWNNNGGIAVDYSAVNAGVYQKDRGAAARYGLAVVPLDEASTLPPTPPPLSFSASSISPNRPLRSPATSSSAS